MAKNCELLWREFAVVLAIDDFASFILFHLTILIIAMSN
jgi:hypothetical protein